MGFLSLAMSMTSTEASLASARTVKHRVTISFTGKDAFASLGHC